MRTTAYQARAASAPAWRCPGRAIPAARRRARTPRRCRPPAPRWPRRRRAGRAENGAHAIGGGRGRNAGSKVEADIEIAFGTAAHVLADVTRREAE